MPSLTFVMPHWLYWAGLGIFPLVAIYLVRRQIGIPARRAGPSLFIAYLFWLTSGFLGIHRFYLRSALGFVFIPVFLLILYCNAQVREVRDDTSRTFAALEQAQNEARIAKPVPGATPEGSAQYEQAQAVVKQRQQEYDVAKAVTDSWYSRSRWSGIVLVILLLGDAIMMPSLVRRQREREAARSEPPAIVPEGIPAVAEPVLAEDPTLHFHSRVTDWIETINVKAGEYVAWWSLIAVFVYYYEVLARFVFNSPTNWVHESMFLMFGMQYMLSGAYAYREDQHVRVDVIYAKFSPRGKAIADIVTSVFFFIFIGTMLVTGYRFAADAVNVGEHSFTEWGIQYWPVKLAIPIGAALLLLQGISKLLKDILFVMRSGA
jgi:TRAP-type mannitol/chloroaromatic compound transport system permease small subunit